MNIGDAPMGLYFQHSDGSFSFVCDLKEDDLPVSKALEDLYERNPKFQSYYQRVWKDDNGAVWIDVGSHTEFYVVSPKQIK